MSPDMEGPANPGKLTGPEQPRGQSQMQGPTIAAGQVQLPQSDCVIVSGTPRLILPAWLGRWPGLAISVDWPHSHSARRLWVADTVMDCTAPGETNAWELTVYHPSQHREEYPHEVFLDGGLSELQAALSATLTEFIEWDSVYGPKLVLNGWACVYGRWEL